MHVYYTIYYLTLILLPTVVDLPFLSDLISSGNNERMNVLNKKEYTCTYTHHINILHVYVHYIMYCTCVFINTHNMKGYRPCIPVRTYCTYLSPLYTLVLSQSQTTPFNDIILDRLHTTVWYPSLLLESPYWSPNLLSNIP